MNFSKETMVKKFAGWCEIMGIRKRIIQRYDDSQTGDNYIGRFYIIQTKWLGIYLHRYYCGDDEAGVHDHPWPSISIILTGGLREYFADGSYKDRRPGAIVFRSAKALHRLELLDPKVTTWTLFTRFKRCRQWGFMTDQGWVPHDEYEETLKNRK